MINNALRRNLYMKKRILAAALAASLVFADLTTIAYAAEYESDTALQSESAPEDESVVLSEETGETAVEGSEMAESEIPVVETEALPETAAETETVAETETEAGIETETAEAETETETETAPETEEETEAEAEEAVLLDAATAQQIAYSAWINDKTIEVFTAPVGEDMQYSYSLYDAAAAETSAADTDTVVTAEPAEAAETAESDGTEQAAAGLLEEGSLTAQTLSGNVHYLKLVLDSEKTYPDEMKLALTNGAGDPLEVFLMKSAVPSQLSAQVVGTTGVKLTWSGSLGESTGWKVQIFEQSKMNKAVSSVTVKGNSAELKNLTPGTVYRAVISQYKEEKDENGSLVRLYDGAKASMFNLNTQAPVLKADNSDLAITISWDKVTGAGSYDVYRSLKGKNSFSKIKTVSGTSYKDSNLKDKTAYDYKVQAIGSNYKGAVSKVLTRTALSKPGKPTKLGIKNAECKVTMNWKKVSGASGYAIFYYNSSTNKLGDKVGTTTDTSYSVKGLQGGKTFKFVVRAFKKTSDGSIVYSNNSAVATGKPSFKKPGAVSGLKAVSADHAVKLTWKSVKNATGYYIYEYNAQTKKVGNRIGSTKELSYLAGDLEPGKTYAFVVYAYRTANGYTGHGKMSSVVSAKAVSLTPAAITGLKAAGGDKEVVLTWNAAKNAQGYTVYQKDPDTGKYTAIGSTKNLKYTAGNLDNKVKYTFRVRAYRKWGVKESHTVYGTYTGDISATTKFSGSVPAPASLSVTNSKDGNKLSWAAVKYATGYHIYRYNFSKSKYEEVATVGAVKTWTDTSIKTTKGKFKYKVAAYRIEEGKTYNGAAIEKVAFGASDIKTVTNKIHAIYYRAYINQGTRIYATFDAPHENKIGTVSAGERVTCMYRRTKRCKIQRANGDIVYIKTSALTYTSEIYTSNDYSQDEKELFVNYKGYSSKTKYLIWISTYSQHVNIFTGKKGNWKLFRSCRCATGAIDTPTPLGGFNINKKQSAKKYKHTYYRYLSKFREANSMHTRIRYYSGGFQDSRLGRPLSHGCVRMEDANAKYVYKNIPLGTSVIVY